MVEVDELTRNSGSCIFFVVKKLQQTNQEDRETMYICQNNDALPPCNDVVCTSDADEGTDLERGSDSSRESKVSSSYVLLSVAI